MSNVERFTGKAATYETYRQRYPANEIITTLREWCNLQPSSLIADIGAGTGMLTEVFLQAGNRVLAIEPNQEMRSICSAVTKRWSSVELVDGTAEATGLAAQSISIVAAGRAFHWFDTQPALAEFRRILNQMAGWFSFLWVVRRTIVRSASLLKRFLSNTGPT